MPRSTKAPKNSRCRSRPRRLFPLVTVGVGPEVLKGRGGVGLTWKPPGASSIRPIAAQRAHGTFLEAPCKLRRALQKNITGINKGMGMGTGTGKMVTLLRSCDSCMRHCSTASLPCTNQHQDIFCWTENTQQSNYGCRTRGNTGAQEARGRPHATWQVTCPRPPHCRSRIDGLHIKLWRTHVPQYNL